MLVQPLTYWTKIICNEFGIDPIKFKSELYALPVDACRPLIKKTIILFILWFLSQILYFTKNRLNFYLSFSVFNLAFLLLLSV